LVFRRFKVGALNFQGLGSIESRDGSRSGDSVWCSVHKEGGFTVGRGLRDEFKVSLVTSTATRGGVELVTDGLLSGVNQFEGFGEVGAAAAHGGETGDEARQEFRFLMENIQRTLDIESVDDLA